MKRLNVIHYSVVFFTITLVSCTHTSNVTNTLLKTWEGPFQGTPAFDKMEVADVKPAMLKAMELNLEEIEAIASNPEPSTFSNTKKKLQMHVEQLLSMKTLLLILHLKWDQSKA